LAKAATYRFGELGWLQFTRLCALVLDRELGWDDCGSFRVAIADEGLAAPGGATRLEPPTLVLVAWVPAGESQTVALRRILAVELDQALLSCAGSVLLLTNAESADLAGLVRMPMEVLGPKRLAELVDARAELRLTLPFVLGIRDLGGLIAPEVAARSTVDLDALAALARVFVPTRAYARTIEVLLGRRLAVLTGPPEMGKTAIARMVALAKLSEGWEACECTRPEQLWTAFARDRSQVFVADDAFGSTEYRPDAAERWALELDRVLRALDDRHWLIWTSRPMPFAAGLRRIHREHGLERFPRPAEVEVDAAALGIDEKALILFRHAKAAGLSASALELVRNHGWEIVSHTHFTPERIRRFVRDRMPALAAGDAVGSELSAAMAAEIREPTTAMAASFAALEPEYRIVLLALLDAPPEPVPERELAAAMRRHAETGFARAPAELVGRLTDHFLRVVPPASVGWVHPSWRDLVIAELAGDAESRMRFLERCGVEGILLALSVAGGPAGDRRVPLLRDDSDWDTVAARSASLLAELDDPSAIRVLGALDGALAAELLPRARHEAVALARLMLERLAGAWRDRRTALPVGALEAWLSLAARVPDPPPAPDVARTWLELAPVEPVDVGSREELVLFDEWLALAAVLDRFAPQELSRFGFPGRHERIFASFVRDARGEVGDDLEALVTRSLRRLRQVVPELAFEATRSRWALAEKDDPWFDVRFETHTRTPEPVEADRLLVERVLSDLG
jgi:hypothetical protein